MSSRNTEIAATVAGVPGGKPVWPITRRFTVLYVASTAVLLLLAVGFLHWALERSLAARDRALVVSKVQVLRLLLRQAPGKSEALISEVEHETSESPLRYFLRILDGQGQLMIETPGMNEVLPTASFPPTVRITDELPEHFEDESRSHGTFLLLSVETPAGTVGQETRTLQVALDTSMDLALLADYRIKLLLVLSAGLIFAAVVGGWLARKGAQPLVEITKSAQHISASQLQERIVVAHWPAELAELAGAFNAMLDRLEDSFRRLAQFSGDLAHELRTPIGNLRCQVEVALARTRTPEEYQQVLSSSLEEYERLSRMIEKLLFLARADNSNAAVKRVSFDARKEVEAVCEFYEALAGEHEVTLTRSGEGWVAGDPVLFGRAVSNLLANAINHTPPKGTASIAIRPGGDSMVEICVRDTGIGIAPEHLPRVFDRFYRVEPSRSQIRGGTGLGLAIVQTIARLHGGTVSLQSRVGQGTTVTLCLPAAAPVRPASQMATM